MPFFQFFRRKIARVHRERNAALVRALKPREASRREAVVGVGKKKPKRKMTEARRLRRKRQWDRLHPDGRYETNRGQVKHMTLVHIPDPCGSCSNIRDCEGWSNDLKELKCFERHSVNNRSIKTQIMEEDHRPLVYCIYCKKFFSKGISSPTFHSIIKHFHHVHYGKPLNQFNKIKQSHGKDKAIEFFQNKVEIAKLDYYREMVTTLKSRVERDNEYIHMLENRINDKKHWEDTIQKEAAIRGELNMEKVDRRGYI